MSPHVRFAWLLWIAILLSACGPDTIFVRPTLDTPTQHVKNGNSFLALGKIDAAYSEFLRAKNLDEGYAPAYVGLALVEGHRGSVEKGFVLLEQAKDLAANEEEEKIVAQGYETLRKMR